MKVVIAVLLALILIVGVLALGEFRYRNCIDAATHATPLAARAQSGVSAYDPGARDRYQRQRMIARCSHSPF